MSEKENKIDEELKKNIRKNREVSEALKKMLIELDKQNTNKKNKNK